MEIIKSKLIEDLDKGPSEVYSKARELIEKRDELNLAKEQIKERHLETAIAVADAVTTNVGTGDSKPTFSNETKRKVETERRLNENPKYIELIKKEEDMRKEIALLEISVTMRSMKFSADKAIARIISSE